MRVSQEFVTLAVDAIQPHPENARLHSGVLAESVKAHGLFRCVIVQKSSMRIVAGHGRWEAAKAEGLATIPVLLADIDDATALRFMIAVNRCEDLSSYNDAALVELLNEVQDDLYGTGFSQDEYSSLVAAEDHQANVAAVSSSEHDSPAEPILRVGKFEITMSLTDYARIRGELAGACTDPTDKQQLRAALAARLGVIL